jgi:hypothetical protein
VLTNTWGGPDPYFDALMAHWSSLAERGDGGGLLTSIALLRSLDAGHASFVECADEWLELVRGFLDRDS